jgi:hypothetical protein
MWPFKKSKSAQVVYDELLENENKNLRAIILHLQNSRAAGETKESRALARLIGLLVKNSPMERGRWIYFFVQDRVFKEFRNSSELINMMAVEIVRILKENDHAIENRKQQECHQQQHRGDDSSRTPQSPGGGGGVPECWSKPQAVDQGQTEAMKPGVMMSPCRGPTWEEHA